MKHFIKLFIVLGLTIGQSLFCLGTEIQELPFADKDFYLLDSLVLENTSEPDRKLLDTTLNLYHTTTNDTLRMNYINHIVENCWDEAIWPRYNLLLKQMAKKKIDTESEVLNKKYLSMYSTTLNNLGYLHKTKGNIPLALDYYNQSLAIHKEQKNTQGIAVTLNNIGALYKNQGDIEQALRYYHESLTLREEINDEQGIAITLGNLGVIYKEQGDNEKALEFYEKSAKKYKAIGSKKGIALALNNIGHLHNEQGNPVQAIKNFKESLLLQQELKYNKGVAYALNNLGYVFNELDSLESALKYFKKALGTYEEIGDKKGISIVLNNIGKAAYKQGNTILAKTYGEQSLTVAKNIGYPDRVRDAANLLSKVYKDEQNYAAALKMYELYITNRDSIANDRNQKEAIRSQTKYEFEKAQLIKEQEQKEKARQLAEKTSRRNNLQYSVILIAILVLFGVILGLGHIKISNTLAEGIIFFSFLILFEFLLVLADPYIENFTGGAPGLTLLVNAGIAALIFPAHAFFEKKLKNRLAN